MTAAVIPFPSDPVRVVPARDDPGCWLVIWHGNAWLHESRVTAMADAHEIAGCHGVRVIVRVSAAAAFAEGGAA
jgi:hypothetical protein